MLVVPDIVKGYRGSLCYRCVNRTPMGWHCSICATDLCGRCCEVKLKKGECMAGHKLVITDRNAQCNKCGKGGNKGFSTCKHCNFDLCVDCAK